MPSSYLEVEKKEDVRCDGLTYAKFELGGGKDVRYKCDAVMYSKSMLVARDEEKCKI